MPTSVLATDLVAEYTFCVVFGPVPLKYHSPASLPSRTTTRQFVWPFAARAAICSSFAPSSPTAAGLTFCQAGPGVSGVAAPTAVASAPASTAALAATACRAHRLPTATSVVV